MVLTYCKAACGLMVVLMVLMETEGARIRKASDQSKHGKAYDGEKKMFPLQLDTGAQASMMPGRALHNASISPWTYKTSNDSSLYPPYVSEAHCLLRGCLDSEGREDLSLESRPILHQILLLRKVRSEHSQDHHYRLEPRLIAVGCTCVQPVVQHQH